VFGLYFDFKTRTFIKVCVSGSALVQTFDFWEEKGVFSKIVLWFRNLGYDLKRGWGRCWKFEGDFADMVVENELKISHKILCERTRIARGRFLPDCGIN
jgi:hypothetical protein